MLAVENMRENIELLTGNLPSHLNMILSIPFDHFKDWNETAVSLKLRIAHMI
jgi:hypothetical protein